MANKFIEKSCTMTILNSDGSLYQDIVKNPCEFDLKSFDKLNELVSDMRMFFGNEVIIRLEFKV